ncbi:hypothetical protein NL676_009082 [Syzygium grande]|nr:hypothetical protein NL676_009082 [Syzygium grande]
MAREIRTPRRVVSDEAMNFAGHRLGMVGNGPAFLFSNPLVLLPPMAMIVRGYSEKIRNRTTEGEEQWSSLELKGCKIFGGREIAGLVRHGPAAVLQGRRNGGCSPVEEFAGCGGVTSPDEGATGLV